MPKSNSRYVSVKWFSEDGKPNIVADPTNRPLQQATVQEYVQRLLKSGLAADVAGLPWMRWSKGPGQHNWPWQALSSNFFLEFTASTRSLHREDRRLEITNQRVSGLRSTRTPKNLKKLGFHMFFIHMFFIHVLKKVGSFGLKV